MQWGEETLTLETGKVARQADGTVIATLGETSVMANVTYAREQKPGQDFFPLTVHYQEKYYAAGKIPGGFFKREARPTEKETLTARLIDRPIRPLFVPGFKNEVLVMCTVLSHDLVNDPDIVAMIAASAALTISGVPFMGPIAGARVGYEDGEYILNPTVDDMQDLRLNPEQRLDLVVAGTKDAVMMVESEAYELTEEEMLGAVTFAHEQIQPVIDLIVSLAEETAKEPFDFTPPDYSDLYAAVKAAGEEKMRAAYAISDKQERVAAVGAAKEEIIASLTEEQREDGNLSSALKKLESVVLRGDVVKNGRRIDGRALDQAKAGRLHILGEMAKSLTEASEFSQHAPRIETMQVPTDKIREVIGSGGKVIREIVEVSGAKVDINDDGVIKIASANGEAIQKAYDMIYAIVAEPEEGAVYTGKVVKIVDFGAFVNFFGKRDGLVHVSQIENRRLNHPSDVLKEGQEVKVKLLGFDDRGKVRLSMKVVDQETGEEIVAEKKEDAE
eukprot:g19860.t1